MVVLALILFLFLFDCGVPSLLYYSLLFHLPLFPYTVALRAGLNLSYSVGAILWELRSALIPLEFTGFGIRLEALNGL